MNKIIHIGALLGALAVMIGAFGAHALKESLSAYELGVFSTGSEYHFYHALALIVYGIYGRGRDVPQWPAWAFVFGIVVFSGSLYCLAIFHMPKLGMITPIGGISFILAWMGFALVAKKDRT